VIYFINKWQSINNVIKNTFAIFLYLHITIFIHYIIKYKIYLYIYIIKCKLINLIVIFIIFAILYFLLSKKESFTIDKVLKNTIKQSLGKIYNLSKTEHFTIDGFNLEKIPQTLPPINTTTTTDQKIILSTLNALNINPREIALVITKLDLPPGQSSIQEHNLRIRYLTILIYLFNYVFTLFKPMILQQIAQLSDTQLKRTLSNQDNIRGLFSILMRMINGLILESISAGGQEYKIDFNTACALMKQIYLDSYPDVKAAGVDAWDHYIKHGRSESRRWIGLTCDGSMPETLSTIPSLQTINQFIPSTITSTPQQITTLAPTINPFVVSTPKQQIYKQTGSEGGVFVPECLANNIVITYGANGQQFAKNLITRPAHMPLPINNNTMGGDPAPGVLKQWSAQYTC